MKSISPAAILLLSIAAATTIEFAHAQRASLPAVSMTCPMHPDVVESRAGACPICRMALVPVRLDSAWMCPVHSPVMSDEEGTCRLCRRQMIRVRVALTFTCEAQRGIDRLEPGTCPDGTPTVVRRTLRPHGNHNPQHGGQFFMAPDNWHHLEGTYPRDRVFRLYVYDDYARPLSPADMKRVQARVVTRETFDPARRTTTELRAFPLRVAGNGAYLEARIDETKLPAEMTAKLRLKAGAPEYRFDFTFTAVTREPAPAAAASAARRPEGAPRPAAPAVRATEDPAQPAASSVPPPEGPPVPAASDVDPALVPVPIPATMEGIVEQLALRDVQIRGLIREGNFAAVWVPAFQAKDLAVALEPHLAHLAPGSRELAEPALQRIVRFAWLLDAFGDVGNRQQLEAAHAAFAAAVADVVKAFGPSPVTRVGVGTAIAEVR